MYTEQSLMQALAKADAEGNEQDAQQLAELIRAQRSQFSQQTGLSPELVASRGVDYLRNQLTEMGGYDPNEGMSGLDKVRTGLGRSLVKTGRGFQQLDRMLASKIDDATGLNVSNAGFTPENAPDAEGFRQIAEAEKKQWDQNATTGMRVSEIGGDIAQFMLPASKISKLSQGSNILTRAAAQGAGAAATDALMQKGEGAKDIDLGRLGVSAAFGGIGELAAPILGRAWRAISKQFRSSDSAADVGAKIVTELGGDPTGMPRKQLSEIAKQAEEFGSDLVDDVEFNIPLNKAEKTRDFEGLARAESMAAANGPAGDIVRARNAQQIRAIDDAADTLAGSNYATANEAGQKALNSLFGQYKQGKAAVGEAYDQFRNARGYMRPEGFKGLGDRLRQRLSKENTLLDEQLPATQGAVRFLDDFAKKIEKMEGIRGGIKPQKLQSLRQTINSQIDKARGPIPGMASADERAAIIVKQEFDNWVSDAMDSDLFVGGDAINKWRAADGSYREFAERFKNQDIGRLMGKIAQDRATPEDVVSYMMNANDVNKKGGALAARSLMRALGDDEPAKQALREAAIIRLIKEPMRGAADKGKSTSILSASRKLGEALSGRGESFMKELFTPKELAKIRRFKQQIDRIPTPRKGRNESGSAYEAGRMMDRTMRALLPASMVDPSFMSLAFLAKVGGPISERMKAHKLMQPLLPSANAPLAPAAAAVGGPAVIDQLLTPTNARD